MPNKKITLPAAKYIRLFSDMHLDFYLTKKHFKPEVLWKPEPLPEDKETILVLAGDIWHAKKPFAYSNYSWFKEIAQRFQYVFVVLGNHDFWGGELPNEYNNFERYAKDLGIDNLYLLQNSEIVVGNYKFLGATLWTNFLDKNDEVVSYAEQRGDFKWIRYTSPIYRGTFKHPKVHNFTDEFAKSKSYLFENAKKDNAEQKLWVITHHPPSFVAVQDDELLKDYKVLGMTATNLNTEIKSSEIDVWLHGHVHNSGEHKVGNTKILVNTVGYPSESDDKFNSGYNPWFQLKLD